MSRAIVVGAVAGIVAGTAVKILGTAVPVVVDGISHWGASIVGLVVGVIHDRASG